MFNLVIGRSGSGKTDELIRRMRKTENAIYIVPEQYSFAAEKKVTAAFSVSGMGNPSVYSFRRLAYYFEEMYGTDRSEDISAAGRVMVLGDIVRKKAQELTLFGSSARRGEMAQESAVIVSTFKQYSVTGDKIRNAMKKTDNPLLRKKLSDSLIITEAYEEFLKSGYRDADDILEGLRKNIERTELLKKRDIFIDSFTAFTPLEMAIIGTMMENCNSVTVSLCIGDDSNEFITAQRTKDELCRIAQKRGVKISEECVLEGAMYAACDEMKAIENSFFVNTVYEGKTDRVHIHRAKNEESEMVAAALEIERLCRDEGYRYRDIVIVAREMADYEKCITRVFSRFNIPLFMDKKTPLSGEAAAIFMLWAIKIISRGWKSEAVFGFMKTPFSPLLPHEADELENYCLASGVRMRDWKSGEDWDMMPSAWEGEKDGEYLERINEYRRRLSMPLIDLENKVKGKHTGREMAVAFYEFMEECGIEEKISAIAEKFMEKGEGAIALRMRQVYDLMISVLEGFDGAFSDKKLSGEEFMSILSTGIESVEIGIIPSNTDSVCAGSIDRARGHGAKVVIIIGAAEGKFPAVPKETGVFTNADRRELEGYGIILPPDTLGKTYMEESLVYSALTCATQRLYVSFCVGAEGNTESSIIKRLYRIFPNAVITDEHNERSDATKIGSAQATYEAFVPFLAKMQKGEDVSDDWYTVLDYYKNSEEWKRRIKEIEKYTTYENKTELIRSELLKDRYGSGITTSVSRLEGYVKCPFSYFASVTLGLEERRELSVTAADSGTFLHEFVDLFGKGLCEDGKTWRDIDKEYIDRKTEEITLSLLAGVNKHMLESSPRIRHLFTELKRIAKRSVTVLSEHMKKGTFEPLGYEIVFDKNGDFKPMTIHLPNGQKAVLRGRIDRADILETERGKFVRIIDYKSGSKKFSLENIYHGFDLQLAIYLTALCETGDYRPAGMLYFKIDDPIIDGAPEDDEDKINKEIGKMLRMDGLVLEDDEILSAMDKGYGAGSDVIPVKKKKDGTYDRYSRVATEGEFKALSRHAKSTVKKLCSEILEGNNRISPVRGACDWCEMKPFCGFDTSIKGCSYRSVESINDKDVLLKMINEEKVQE